MTNAEIQVIATAEKYHSAVDLLGMLKKLGEEFAEVAMALQEGDAKHIREEIGDCGFILLHMLQRLPGSEAEKSLNHIVLTTAEKMESRGGRGYFDKYRVPAGPIPEPTSPLPETRGEGATPAAERKEP